MNCRAGDIGLTGTELPDALEAFGLGRPALIADPFLAQSGALDRVTASLAGRGVPSRVFTGVVPDPTTGAVGAAGQRLHVATPINAALLALLRAASDAANAK